MFPTRFVLLTTGLALCLAGCKTGEAQKPVENKFYKNGHVRRCLQLDKEQRSSEAQACWSKLLRELESDAEFRTSSELSDKDVGKVRQMVGQSAGRSHGLRRKLEACFNMPSSQRDKRLACFEGYLTKYRDRLSVGERYEVETAITAMKQARERVAGNIENTVEHAGKLLGAKLHLEDEGIRIDAVESGPSAQAQIPEQGIIVAIDDTPVQEFDATEVISRLEACQDRPITLLIRQGGIKDVSFTRAECQCGKTPSGKKEWQVQLPAEICTEAGSPELRLGISWCYLPRDGILEVEEVCKGSAADAAGVQPEQQYVSINGRMILGMTYPQIVEILKKYPTAPLAFRSRAGALQSPSPLVDKPLGEAQCQQFWKAVKRSIEAEEKPGPK